MREKNGTGRSLRLLVVLLAAMSLIAAACGDDSGSGVSGEPAGTTVKDSGSSEGAQPELVKVTFGGGAYLQTAQVTLALVNGLFEDNGLKIEVADFATGRAALTALLGGQVDLAVMAEFPPVTAALQGEDFKIVADLGRFSDYKVQTRTDAGVKSLSDLAGKSVGTTVGTNVQYALETALNNAGLDSADVDIVNLPPNGIAGALDQGDVDAGMPFDSFYLGIQDVLGDRYAEVPVEGYTIHFVLVASAEMSRNTAVLEAFLQTLKDAEPFLEDSNAAKEAIVGYSERVNQAYADDSFTKYDFETRLNSDLLDLMVSEGTWLVETQGLDGDPTEELFRSVLDAGPLEVVAPGSSDLGS